MQEAKFLSSMAILSKNSRGRKVLEEKCSLRTEFQRDRDRVIHSKAFRRLKHKTQVFISPEGDHYRTRLTHTLEVSQIARTISRSLRLNEDLTEAIALAHDLGHTPFGHTGERTLDEVSINGFKHYMQSLRVVEYLERYNGLNLTFEVKDGIVSHSSSRKAKTNEGRVVRVSDKIAYINHDIDDAIRAGLLSCDCLPKECIAVLGDNHSKRINTMIKNVISNATTNNEVDFYLEVGEAIWELRDFLFKNVYIGSKAKVEEEKAMNIVREMYNYYIKDPEKMPKEFYRNLEKWGIESVVCDYIAGMTDRFAISEYLNIFVPSPWRKIY
ncbi:deoxyguanosinetriphosphate triphosphohydrolase [Clostridium cylindrosporum DSM 605]|uniref:Deoxyguanosinetriphosphate triphosphohydrolase-like protein n=1 Tax=Clostridium cylindrosporum DSM 605 TaxID=1121307 RepID=A0A0J8DBJ1_CLOCY|nr:deoxyguanosinetriphosphate triphosphohydrolase [Clostridium cylindrosporum DSM 605]